MKLSRIAEITGGKLIGDGALEITGVADIRSAGKGDITFLDNSKYETYLSGTESSAVILSPELENSKCRAALLICKKPSAEFAKVTESLYQEEASFPSGIRPSACVSKTAIINEDVSIGENTFIGDNTVLGARTVIMPGAYVGRSVIIGDDCCVYPNAAILDKTVMGNETIIHSNSVIGSDGFGYDQQEGVHVKIKQLGIVSIGDNVEIGACVTIDRARFGKTVIGSGTKIDNLVQVAHNVRIGRNCLIVSQTGLSGSTIIGDNVVFAGRSGSHGHVTVHDGAMISGNAVVTKDVPSGQVYSGYPARPAGQHRRSEALRIRLPELYRRIKDLEKKVLDK